jgi:hypothetical protein
MSDKYMISLSILGHRRRLIRNEIQNILEQESGAQLGLYENQEVKNLVTLSHLRDSPTRKFVCVSVKTND